MRQQKNTTDRYIQLVETFITAIESGKSGAELEDIRKEIRMLSTTLKSVGTVDIAPQNLDFLPLDRKLNEGNTEMDRSIR